MDDHQIRSSAKAIFNSVEALSRKNQMAFAPVALADLYEQVLAAFLAGHPQHRSINIPTIKQGDAVVASMGCSGSTLVELATGCRVILNLLP